MIQVDESNLKPEERFGLLWCRLNCGEWDELLGEKPDGFDELPLMTRRRLFGKKEPCKYDLVYPIMMAIKSLIGDARVSKCWWVFGLGKTEEEWFAWYLTERFLASVTRNRPAIL